MDVEPTGGSAPDQWGPVARIAIAVGAVASVVSVSLFIHTISQLASPIVSTSFIAAGIVGRRRATTPLGQILALATLVGGIVGAAASIALVAAGR